MLRIKIVLPVIFLVLFVLSVPCWGAIQSGIAMYGDGAHVKFAQPFSEVPVVVTSGQSGGAIMVGAANNSKTGFDLKILDLNGNPIRSGVWVQWIAATYESGIELGLAQYNNGQHINFQNSLPGCTILTSGQKNGIPYLVGAVNNSSTGFDLSVLDYNGAPGSKVWVQWIAVKPGSDWRCGVNQFSNGQNLTFSAMPVVPVIFASSQAGGAIAAAGINNSKTGCLLSLLTHSGQSAQGAWTQWWAVKPGIVSTATGPTTSTPSGPVSTNDIIYLNSPRLIINANFGDKGESKSLSSAGWSDYNKHSMYCRAFSLAAGFVEGVGGSASYWSKVGQKFDVQQGSYSSTTRAATIRVQGDYAGSVMAAILATSNAKLSIVVTDNGTEVANKQIFSKSGAVASWNNFSGNFSESLPVTLKANHSYNVYLHLETSAVAAVAGSAGADVGQRTYRVRYFSISITF